MGFKGATNFKKYSGVFYTKQLADQYIRTREVG